MPTLGPSHNRRGASPVAVRAWASVATCAFALPVLLAVAIWIWNLIDEQELQPGQTTLWHREELPLVAGVGLLVGGAALLTAALLAGLVVAWRGRGRRRCVFGEADGPRAGSN